MGLEEGWARIDPQTAEIRFIRSAALAADQSALVTKQAQALDEMQTLLRNQEQEAYQNKLQEMDKAQANAGQLDPSVQAKLARREFDQQGVPIDVDQAKQLADAELGATPDPAMQNAEVNVVDTKLDADAMQQEELARLADEVTAVDPDQQVRELLGVDPDAIDLTLEKSPDGRGWVVIDSTGEQLGERFTTKRAAQRKLDAEKKRLKADTQKRAQQVADDQSGTVADLSISDPARDSDLVTSVKLTKPQINELIKYPNFKPIFDQFGVAKKTYQFTQGDLSDFIDGARAMIAAGVDGRRARMLKTLIDKFDTSVKLLEPEVRRQRTIASMLDETKRFLDHGDYC